MERWNGDLQHDMGEWLTYLADRLPKIMEKCDRPLGPTEGSVIHDIAGLLSNTRYLAANYASLRNDGDTPDSQPPRQP